MKSEQRLRYYIHDEPDAFRLELSGSLSGDALRDVYHAWRTALSIVGERPVIIDVTYAEEADARGRALLVSWRRSGARIVASSAASRRLAESILGEPFAEPPAQRSFFQRLGAWARGSAGRLTAVTDRPRVECRLR